jgi:biotin carboxylase
MNKYIVFINSVRPGTREAIVELEKTLNTKLSVAVLVNSSVKKEVFKATNFNSEEVDVVLEADFDSISSVRQNLKDINDDIVAISCHFENSIGDYCKIIPLFPYLHSPSESSLIFSTEKIRMRQLFSSYHAPVSAKAIKLENTSNQQLALAKNTIGYPMVIKPSGLAGSQLVTLAENEEQLLSGLTNVFLRIDQAYEQELTRRKPTVLVEEYLDGEMYSFDIYVNSHGNTIATPSVHITTGRSVGYDDFFGYMRITPTNLSELEEQEAVKAAVLGVKSLGLRSTTAHVELKYTRAGNWKLLEIGPRIGGYRNDMYKLSFGINHIGNDIMTKLDKVPILPSKDKAKGYTAVFNFYAKQEGEIVNILGLDLLKKNPSLYKINSKKAIGEKALFARNNGEAVLSVTLFNKSYDKLMIDCVEAEKAIEIITK